MAYQQLTFLYDAKQITKIIETTQITQNIDILENSNLNSDVNLGLNLDLETLLQIFEEYQALSVSTEDANLDTLDEMPLYAEPNLIDELPTLSSQDIPWQTIKIEVLFDDQANIPEIIKNIYEEFNYLVKDYQIIPIDEQNWVQLTQSQFPPILIGEQVAIVPSWHALEDFNGRRASLQLDPGLAFGTGSHPTTALCLTWLDEFFKNNNLNNENNNLNNNKIQRVLDYGCGSGILGMVAKKLGASEVIGVDIDAQAIQASRNNCEANQLQLTFHTTAEDISEYYKTCDVVLANILSNPLKLLAPLLPQFLKQGAYLVMSGILERQTQELIDVYAPFIKLSVYKTQDEWVCLVGQKI